MSERFVGVSKVVLEATDELKISIGKYPSYPSMTHGSITVEHLANDLRHAARNRDKLEAYHVAKKIAAASLRYMVDCNHMKAE